MTDYINKSNKQNKLRPLFILKLLMELTDDESYLTTPEIMDRLDSEYGLKVCRQTIKYDIDQLTEIGFEIERTKGISYQYRYVGRTFDTAELRILIDAVISSKSLSRQKSLALAQKLSSLAGICPSYALNKSIDVNVRVKTPNESIYEVTEVGVKTPNEAIYYITDAINKAISLECKIAFHYFEYNSMKEKKYKNKGKEYIFSPYRMLWDGDFYYVIGYSDKHKKVASFRIDHIDRAPVVLEEESAIPMPVDFDLNEFINSMPRMLDSEREKITIEFDNDTACAVFDRFGYDVNVTLIGNGKSSITVCTAVGPVLYSWIAGFAGRVKLIASDKVMEEYREMLIKALGLK